MGKKTGGTPPNYGDYSAATWPQGMQQGSGAMQGQQQQSGLMGGPTQGTASSSSWTPPSSFTQGPPSGWSQGPGGWTQTQGQPQVAGMQAGGPKSGAQPPQYGQLAQQQAQANAQAQGAPGAPPQGGFFGGRKGAQSPPQYGGQADPNATPGTVAPPISPDTMPAGGQQGFASMAGNPAPPQGGMLGQWNAMSQAQQQGYAQPQADPFMSQFSASSWAAPTQQYAYMPSAGNPNVQMTGSGQITPYANIAGLQTQGQIEAQQAAQQSAQAQAQRAAQAKAAADAAQNARFNNAVAQQKGGAAPPAYAPSAAAQESPGAYGSPAKSQPVPQYSEWQSNLNRF